MEAISVPFRAANYLTPSDISGFLAEALADGDCRALPLVLRTVADVIGMRELAARTGLSRATLHRIMSAPESLRLDTMAAFLSGFGLRLAVVPVELREERPA